MAPVTAAQAQPVQRTDNFLAVTAAAGRYGAGGGNVLVRSPDGQAWQRQELPRAASIISMAGCPDGALVALDFRGKIWILPAHGTKWIPRDLKGKFNPLDVTCDPNGKIWVVGGYTTIESSADAGRTWKLSQGEDAILRVVRFVDAQHGYIAGEFGTFLATADGGQTWAPEKGLPSEFYPFAMIFLDLDNGWVTGPAGVILHTADGGKTWTQQNNASGLPVYALFERDGHLYGAGQAGQLLVESSGNWLPVSGLPQERTPVMAAVATRGGALIGGPGGFLRLVKWGGVTAGPGNGSKS